MLRRPLENQQVTISLTFIGGRVSALALLMIKLTRAIVQQDGLPDNSFEVLLELQHLMQRIIETK